MDRGHLKVSPDNGKTFLYLYANTREVLLSQKVMFYQFSRTIKIIIKNLPSISSIQSADGGGMLFLFFKGEELKQKLQASLQRFSSYHDLLISPLQIIQALPLRGNQIKENHISTLCSENQINKT